MRYWLAAGACALVCVSSVHAQEAQLKCAPRAELVKVLEAKLGQKPIAIGLVNDHLIMETFASVRGDWTMFFTDTRGVSCVASNGTAWQFDTRPFEGAKKGRGA